MKASDMLRNNNGLKTTQSVLNKQQSGVDAAQKVAQTQATLFSQQQLATDSFCSYTAARCYPFGHHWQLQSVL